MNTETVRAKTTYLLQAIERGLGDFTLDKALLYDELESVGVDEDTQSSARDRISESYLSDLFGLALRVSKGTSAQREVLHLKALAESLGIYEIRNACAHPNRPFFSHYWYRIASLAQDPSFRLIGLERVSDALASAESGTFENADSKWSFELRRIIRNNLPAPFEHDRTGLVGREKALDQLVKLLVAGRFPTIALVAPGGLGKTALALEVLKKIAYSSVGNCNAELVIFVSLKTQRLTAEGLQIFDAPPTVEELEGKLAVELSKAHDEESDSSLSYLIEAHSERNVLLCIDNLENILLSGASEFEGLLGRLPQRWRLLITTRIPVNSAHCITLGALQPSPGNNLSMSYAKSVGLQISRESSDNIARVCSNNPLSIKLTIDAVSAGKGIEVALESALSGTLKFSYDLLLDSLSEDMVTVLEVLFAAGSITRSDIALILDWDVERIADSIGTLARTSLVYSRIEAYIEMYGLNDAVRELLRIHPRNLKIRSNVSQIIANRRQQADKLLQDASRNQYEIFSDFYVPVDHPSALREISKLIKRGKSGVDVEAALAKLTILEPDCREIDTFWTLRGIALARFRDPQAEYSLRRSLEIGSELRVRCCLARWLKNAKRFPEAADEYAISCAQGACDPSVVGPDYAVKNIRAYLVSELFAERYSNVFNLTEKFVMVSSVGETLCAVRASAARMLFHNERNMAMLRECFSTLALGLKTYGYTHDLSKEGLKVINDLYRENSGARLEMVACELVVEFICDHYVQLFASAPEKQIQDEGWAWSNILEFSDSLGDSEVLRARLFKVAGVSEESGIRPLVSIPIKICGFSHSPSRSFRFGEDRVRQRHHLALEKFDAGRESWASLLPGMQIYIVPGGEAEEGRAPTASQISLRPIFGPAEKL